VNSRNGLAMMTAP